MKRLCLLISAFVLSASLFSQKAYAEDTRTYFTSIEELAGCDFANADSNSGYEADIAADIPGVTFHHYTNYFDTFVEVSRGKVDAAFTFYGLFPGLQDSYPDLVGLKSDKLIPIVLSFSEKTDFLRTQFNEYAAKAREDGSLDALYKKWVENYSSNTEYVDFSDLDGENGTYQLALNPTTPPYEYLADNKLAGFEPALIHEFCREYGYRPDVIQTDFDSAVAGVSTGKYDIGAGCYGFNAERSEGMNFSEPYLDEHFCYVVAGAPSARASLISTLKEGFYRNFIREHRWQLLVSGLGASLLITILSVLLGSGLGFLLFVASRKYHIFDRVFMTTQQTLESLPVLVILMIFFYVIFGSLDISGIAISVIVFGLLYTFTFYSMISQSVKGVSAGQEEGGLALGYHPRQVLF